MILWNSVGPFNGLDPLIQCWRSAIEVSSAAVSSKVVCSGSGSGVSVNNFMKNGSLSFSGFVSKTKALCVLLA